MSGALRGVPAFAAAAAALLMAGCAVKSGLQLAEQGRVDLQVAQVCGPTLADIQPLPLPLKNTPFVIDKSRQAFAFEGGKAFLVSFELPAFNQVYSITLASMPNGAMHDEAIFVPKVLMLDGEHRVTRRYDERELRTRGTRLERTVFINPSNSAERYMVVYGAPLTADFKMTVQEITTQTVSTVYGSFNWADGRDVKKTIRSSPVGRIEVSVQGLEPAKP